MLQDLQGQFRTDALNLDASESNDHVKNCLVASVHTGTQGEKHV